MQVKLLIAFNAVVASIGIFLVVHLNDVEKSVLTLAQRATDLEAQNAQLSSQFKWMVQRKASTERSSDARRSRKQLTNSSSRAMSKRAQPNEAAQTAAASHVPAPQVQGDVWGSSFNRQTVAAQNEYDPDGEGSSIFTDQQEQQTPENWENDEVDWEDGLRNSMSLSLDEFAEENMLDDNVKSSISHLLDHSVNQRSDLRDLMASNNLSLEEYVEENHKLREEVARQSSTYLTEEQQKIFVEKFHMDTMREEPQNPEADMSSSRGDE